MCSRNILDTCARAADGISLASVGLKLTAAVLLLHFYIETCAIQCFVLGSTKRSKVDFFFLLWYTYLLFS